MFFFQCMANKKKDMNEGMVIELRVVLPHKIYKFKVDYYQIEKVLKTPHQFEKNKKKLLNRTKLY